MQLRSTLHYLAYPANLASIVLIVFASLMIRAGIWAGLFGVPLIVIMLTWFFKYGLVMVEHIAWDVEGEPVLAVEMLNPLEQKKSGILLLITLMFSALYWAAQYWLGAVAGSVIGLVAIALLPAIVVVQTATDTALKALDPRDWFRAIRWMKADYVQVLVAILIFWLLAAVLLFTSAADFLWLVVKIAMLMFGWFSVLALLGGSILERRIADPDDSPLERHELEVSAQEIAKRRERQVDSIYGEWRSGSQKNAWQTLMRTVDGSEDPIAELRFLLERTAGWHEPRLSARIAQELVPRLLAISRYSEAITVTRQQLQTNPDYRPLTAHETLRMARIARDGGDRPTARALLHDFQRAFPNDPLQPAADDLTQQLQR